eukprot:3352063-Pleurochrysis_carterae.AAC.1
MALSLRQIKPRWKTGHEMQIASQSCPESHFGEISGEMQGSTLRFRCEEGQDPSVDNGNAYFGLLVEICRRGKAESSKKAWRHRTQRLEDPCSCIWRWMEKVSWSSGLKEGKEGSGRRGGRKGLRE